MKTAKRWTTIEPDLSSEERAGLVTLYRACVRNARCLFDEARLLANHRKYARAFFLAYTAREELGKAEMVADYATGCSSKAEFLAAFRDHKIKTAYMGRFVACDLPPAVKRVKNPWSDAVISYDVNGVLLEIKMRERALYVNYKDAYGMVLLPSEIKRNKCTQALQQVKYALDAIRRTEKTGIGSKALFKTGL